LNQLEQLFLEQRRHRRECAKLQRARGLRGVRQIFAKCSGVDGEEVPAARHGHAASQKDVTRVGAQQRAGLHQDLSPSVPDFSTPGSGRKKLEIRTVAVERSSRVRK